MIYVITDPSYANSVWCQNLVDGLIAELKFKRYEYEMISSMEFLREDAEYVFVIGSTIQWIQAALEGAIQVGTYPILLCNCIFQSFPQNYSVVSSDINGSMQHLIGLLHQQSKSKIALYGVNPRSASDAYQKSSFLSASKESEDCVFNNETSLNQCFQEFYSHIREYDAVVCTNDFAAISLIRNLLKKDQEELNRLTIIGCTETRLTYYYSKYLISIQINYTEFGRVAVTIMDSLKKNKNISNVVTHIRWNLKELDEKADERINSELSSQFSAVSETRDTFYEDEELKEMLRVEQLLNKCDQLDYQILYKLLKGETYEEISEEYYINVSTVKYRIRKIVEISQTNGRKELVKLLKEYIYPNI